MEELEALGKAALIASEEKTSPMCRRPAVLFVCRQLWSELHTPAHDAMRFDRNRGPIGWHFEIVPGVGLANMGREGASKRRVNLSREKEVVVPIF